MAIKEAPTLYPTEEQFRDPISYLSSPEIAALGQKYGIVKLVAPNSFTPPLSINKSKFKFVPRLQKLKELNILNRCRSFFHKQLLNFNKMTDVEVPNHSYESFNDDKFYYYDFFIQVVKFYQADKDLKKNGIPNISNDVIMNDLDFWTFINGKFPNFPISSLKSIYSKKLLQYFNYLSSKPYFSTTKVNNNTSLLQQEEESDDEESENLACLICSRVDDPENTLLCDCCNKPYHRYCLTPRLTYIPKGNWYCEGCILGNGQYGFKDSSFQYSLNDFEELCNDFDNSFFKDGKTKDINELEAMFWKLVEDDSNDVNVNYGADIHNSQKGQVSGFPTFNYTPADLKLTKDEYKSYIKHPMNLNNLPFDKNSLLSYLNVDISGMTIPWIYIGSTFSTFCWHVEDQWTLSANYQHFGDVKKWYCIPESNALKFEKFMQNLAPDLFMKQPDILHQLITLISPFKLIENDIECYTANQNPGEYIITYPRVYHAGFNSGYNFNEAVNFTMTNWLQYGIESSLNYQKFNVSKSSVFDIWELIINILQKSRDDDDSVKDLPLIEKSIKFLKDKLNDEYQLYSTVTDQIQAKPRLHPRLINKSKEEGVACSGCKGFCTFFYIKHYIPTISTITSNNYLLTPQASPNDEESPPSKRRSKRIKVKQDNETYDIQLLCVEDYLKLDKCDGNLDELFIVRDIEEVKKLVKDMDLKYGKL